MDWVKLQLLAKFCLDITRASFTILLNYKLIKFRLGQVGLGLLHLDWVKLHIQDKFQFNNPCFFYDFIKLDCVRLS